MRINNINNTSFNGGLDGLSKALYTLSNNDMLNASFVDIFAMDTPRTIIETKYRGKQAGIEMGFREYTGTFIAEFSAAVFAVLVSKLFSKNFKPETKVNSSSWVTNNALDVFNDIFNKSDKTPFGYVKNILNSTTGVVGSEKRNLADINKETLKPIIEKLSNLITNKNVDKKTLKKELSSIQDEIISVLKADKIISIKSDSKEVTTNLTHALRDIVDTGRNIFFKENTVNPKEIISKLKTMNKLRIGLAIPMSMILAISNQALNRYLTKKRTGIDNFVGENNYENNVKDKNQKTKEKGLMVKKLLSAGLFVFMLTKVMGVKSPFDLIRKLEFDGPVTSGNAIKTVYGTLILGRIFASKDSTELRETNTRDYLGFLNWLVLGGFVSKGIAQALDPRQKDLFNITKEGSGIGHWLKDVSLKSQKEIIAQGGNVKANLKKLNFAQLGGIAYSALMLGVLLPRFNIWMTKHKKPSQKETKIANQTNSQKIAFQSFDEFLKSSKTMVRNYQS